MDYSKSIFFCKTYFSNNFLNYIMQNFEVVFQLISLFFVLAAGPAVVVLVASQKGNL